MDTASESAQAAIAPLYIGTVGNRPADPSPTQEQLDPASPDFDPTLIPGHIWTTDGVTFKRAKNGMLMKRVLVPTRGHKSTRPGWVFTRDDSRPISWSLRKHERAAARDAADRIAGIGPAVERDPPVAGIEGLPNEDKVRVKLRQAQRRLLKGVENPPTKLTTLADVHSLAYATRYIDGGRDAFISFIQGAMLEGLPEASAWFRVFSDLLPYERKIASLDDICAAAGVKPSRLIAEIVTTVMERGRDVGNLVAAALHPGVVAALAKSGATIDGANPEIHHKDRIAFLQGMGTLPLPKGVVINNNVNASAMAAAAAAAEPSMPSFADDMRGVTGTRTIGQRALAASTDDLEWAPPARQPQPAVIEAESTEGEE